MPSNDRAALPADGKGFPYNTKIQIVNRWLGERNDCRSFGFYSLLIESRRRQRRSVAFVFLCWRWFSTTTLRLSLTLRGARWSLDIEKLHFFSPSAHCPIRSLLATGSFVLGASYRFCLVMGVEFKAARSIRRRWWGHDYGNHRTPSRRKMKEVAIDGMKETRSKETAGMEKFYNEFQSS